MAKFIAGIDEAGRGPVIGPLVMCVAAIQEGREKELKELGVKDSKLLTEKQREDILKSLIKIIHYELVIIPPDVIDAAVFSKTYNLNWLEADNAVKLLNKISEKINIVEAIIDCPSTNIDAYTNYLKKKIEKNIKLRVEHKADLHHLIVGASSIVAKVTREKELEKLKKKFDIDFGSGYPADPKTKMFLEKHHDNSKIQHLFRKSWSTYSNMKKGKQMKLEF